jgi:hemerythrin-like metal-binding protein
MLAWSEQFATGSPLIDTQHRMLIDKINELERLLAGPPPPAKVCSEFLDYLGLYVVTHFKFEEQCMASAKCPAHEQNKKAHADFLAGYGKFKEQLQKEGPKLELLKHIHLTASNWIKQHILTVDIQLRQCGSH